jgi:putative transposase
VQEHQLPVQRACRVVRLSRAAFYRPPVPTTRRDAAVIAALTDVVARYPRWGFWKLFDRMRVEGRRWNHKHVHRVYCALRLNLPRRTTRRVPRRVRQPLSAPPRLNQTWALDFMTETLYDGRRVRLLTMIDEGNREGLEIVKRSHPRSLGDRVDPVVEHYGLGIAGLRAMSNSHCDDSSSIPFSTQSKGPLSTVRTRPF